MRVYAQLGLVTMEAYVGPPVSTQEWPCFNSISFLVHSFPGLGGSWPIKRQIWH